MLVGIDLEMFFRFANPAILSVVKAVKSLVVKYKIRALMLLLEKLHWMRCPIMATVNVTRIIMEMAALWILTSLKNLLIAIMVSSTPETL